MNLQSQFNCAIVAKSSSKKSTSTKYTRITSHSEYSGNKIKQHYWKRIEKRERESKKKLYDEENSILLPSIIASFILFFLEKNREPDERLICVIFCYNNNYFG